MPNPRMKQRRVVHKSTAGILKPIPEAVDLVGNPPPRLTTKTVALLHRRVTANCRSAFIRPRYTQPAAEVLDFSAPALRVTVGDNSACGALHDLRSGTRKSKAHREFESPPLQQRGSANRRSRSRFPERELRGAPR